MRTPDIRPYKGKFPQIAASAYIDPAAVVIGDVGNRRRVQRVADDRGARECALYPDREAHQYSGWMRVARDERPVSAGAGRSSNRGAFGDAARVHDSFSRFDWDGLRHFERRGDWRELDYCGGDIELRTHRDSRWKFGDGFAGQSERELTEQTGESIGKYAERYAAYRVIYREEAAERGEQIDWSKLED